MSTNITIQGKRDASLTASFINEAFVYLRIDKPDVIAGLFLEDVEDIRKLHTGLGAWLAEQEAK